MNHTLRRNRIIQTFFVVLFSGIWLCAQTVLFCGIWLCAQKTYAQHTTQTVQRIFPSPQPTLSDDFVTTSIVITDPGQVLYSQVGHAFLRMQCPDHNLDYCFSYESEDVSERVLTFLAGKLKMGLCAIPTQEYLKPYQQEGRGVYQYDLQLPIRVKQNLWRILDEEKAQGMQRPYDYIERGCAISILHLLQQALGHSFIDYGEWPEDFSQMNRREILSRSLEHAPWTKFTINFLTNGSSNEEVPNPEKLITPQELVAQLQHATLQGKPLLNKAPQVLVKSTQNSQAPARFTPTVVALILLFFTLLCAACNLKVWDYVLLALQSLAGLLNVYLVCFSTLCATEWSWLLIPLNPFPLLFWKWRSQWALPYGIVLCVWIAAMLFAPHSLTETSYILLAAAIAINHLNYRRDKLFPRRTK